MISTKATLASSVRHRRRSARRGPLSLTPAQRLLLGCKQHELALVGLLLALPVVLLVFCEILRSMLKFCQFSRPKNLGRNRYASVGSRSSINATNGGSGSSNSIYYSHGSKCLKIRLSSRFCALGFLLVMISCDILALSTGQLKLFFKIGALAQETDITATINTTISSATTNAAIISSMAITKNPSSTARSLNQHLSANGEPGYCPDCGTAGDSNCDNVHRCTASCGQVKSVNYPNNYGNNHRCRWSIKAPEAHYVNLSIIDFDIPSAGNAMQCIFDYLTLIDGYTLKRLGCYCNEHRPPQYIVSPWNELIIQFDTNSNTTGRGFHFKYQFMRLELNEHLESLLKPPSSVRGPIGETKSNYSTSTTTTTGCHPGWQYFRGSCYKAYHEQEPLQWWDAEKICEKMPEAHLVSILDKDEMLVILHLLTNVWKSKRYTDFYIGLIDISREGLYRWIDSNPMSYTDWELKPILLEEETLAQPDGGAYEDCTIIRYNSFSRTSNWHDVPCSLGKHYHYHLEKTIQTSYKAREYVTDYICKVNIPHSDDRRALYLGKPNLSINESNLRHLDRSKYFVCDNSEVISVIFRCDGITHCRDGSDEKNDCDQDCLDWQFKCAKSGRCTSIGNYCNFVDDCGDGSDESHCERHRCKLHEFRCQNGECIPAQQRCDLISDCSDSSDEGILCTVESKCNSKSSFQCYNGLCIPQYAVCDFQIDCPGKFHEDEDGPTCDLILKSRSSEYSNQTNLISSNSSNISSNIASNITWAPTGLAKYASPQRVSHTMSAQLQQDPSSISSSTSAKQLQQQQQNMFRCKSGNMISSNLSCLYEFDRYGYQIGCRDVSHLMDCADFECPELDYVKCANSYCIPWRYVCDGKWDCIMGDDEVGCNWYVCPGQYKCANHSSCIPLHQLCDNTRQCPMGDDEFFCDLQCPPGCNCIGQSVDCHNASLSSLPGNYISKSVRKLDLSENRLGPNLSNCDFSAYHDLGELILNYNGIEVLIPRKFIQLRNLYKLDLSNNQIHSVKRGAFAGLRRVTQLLLESNPELVIVEPEAFFDLAKLQILNISSSRILTLRKNTFAGLTSLRHLLLRSNMIVEIEDGAFRSLNNLVSLDMRGNEIRHFTKQVFTDLKSLRNLSTDSFKFCCLMNHQIEVERCLPLPDEISDCEDLLSSVLQRTCIWINGIAACIGNLIVIVWRYRDRLGNIKEREVKQVNSTLLLSLACSDLLMGIYLIFIAIADSWYRGRYIENADNWRESAQCNLAGSLITVSSQVSVFILVSIAYNRYTEICLPFNSPYKLTLELTHRLIVVYWCVALLIATMPLFITPYFRGQFYAKSGVCMAFHITNQKAAGWLYSIVIFICPKLIAFFIIVYCYKQISVAISQICTARNQNRADRPNQVRIAIILLTHFVAWSPTIFIELMSLAGIPLPAKVYSWIAVLVLPVNSAINPMIYTIPNIRNQIRTLMRNHRARKSGHLTAIQRLNNNSNHSGLIPGLNHHQMINGQQTKELLPILTANADVRQRLTQRNIPPGYVPLRQFIRQSPQLDTQCLIRIALEISRDIEKKHCEAKVYASLNLDSVFISDRVSSFPALTSFANTGSAADGDNNGDQSVGGVHENATAVTGATAIAGAARSAEPKLRIFLADHEGYRLKRSQCSHDQVSMSGQQCHRHHRTMQNCECFDVNRFGDILFKLIQLYNNAKLDQSEEAAG